MKLQDKPLTEQSELRVCTHPELSFWTQQPDSLSRSLAFRISLTICLSWRMHGENLAPRWIRSSWKVEEIIVKIHKRGNPCIVKWSTEEKYLKSIRYMHYFWMYIMFLCLLTSCKYVFVHSEMAVLLFSRNLWVQLTTLTVCHLVKWILKCWTLNTKIIRLHIFREVLTRPSKESLIKQCGARGRLGLGESYSMWQEMQ